MLGRTGSKRAVLKLVTAPCVHTHSPLLRHRTISNLKFASEHTNNSNGHKQPPCRGTWFSAGFAGLWLVGFFGVQDDDKVKRFLVPEKHNSEAIPAVLLCVLTLPQLEVPVAGLFTNYIFLDRTNRILFDLAAHRGARDDAFAQVLLQQLNVSITNFPTLGRDLVQSNALTWLPAKLAAWGDELLSGPNVEITENELDVIESFVHLAATLAQYSPDFRESLTTNTAINMFLIGEHSGSESLACDGIKMMLSKWKTGGSLIVLDSGVVDALISANYHESWWSNLGRATSDAIHVMQNSIPTIPDDVVGDDVERRLLIHEDSIQLTSYEPSSKPPTIIEDASTVTEVFTTGLLGYMWGNIRARIRARMHKLAPEVRPQYIRAISRRAALGSGLLVLLFNHLHPLLHDFVMPPTQPSSYFETLPMVGSLAMDAFAVGGYGLVNFFFPFSTIPFWFNPISQLGLQRHKPLTLTVPKQL